MVKIRLRRVGAKKQPSYRIVVTDSRAPRDSAALEVVGHYNPRTNPPKVVVKEDRALHWLNVGAQPSDPVRRFFDGMGLPEKLKQYRKGEWVPAASAAAPVKSGGRAKAAAAPAIDVAAAAAAESAVDEAAGVAAEAPAAATEMAAAIDETIDTAADASVAAVAETAEAAGTDAETIAEAAEAAAEVAGEAAESEANTATDAGA